MLDTSSGFYMTLHTYPLFHQESHLTKLPGFTTVYYADLSAQQPEPNLVVSP